MGTEANRDDWTSHILLERFREGDGPAADALFARYFERLTAMTRGLFSTRLARRADPEDVALSAYRSFFVRAREGRYALGREGDLWRLLSAIARHKLLKRARRERAARRSIDRDVPLTESNLSISNLRTEPTPEDAAALADELERAFTLLDPLGRRVLELRLQGLTTAEISGAAGCSERTARRALVRIRQALDGRLGPVTRDGSGDGGARSSLEPEIAWFSNREFLLRRLIGQGSVGKVFAATRRDGAGEVAVKFLRKTLLRHPRVVERFVGEARTVARLRHPNIVATRGLGRTDGGSYFIVMDLVAGRSLAEATRDAPVAEADAVSWGIAICEALEHAHGRGVVHCDLKPANILLDDEGRIRVADFGLARSLSGDDVHAADIEGTAPFMAPEQVSQTWGPIGARTDVYGLGAVVYTLLTGRPPQVGRGLADILDAVIAKKPVVSAGTLRSDLSPMLAEFCRRCLSKRPKDRYPTADLARAALEAIATGSSPFTAPSPLTEANDASDAE